MTIRVLSVFGTRPEAIKMAPVVLGLAKSEEFDSRVCVTGQHRHMLDQVLNLFEIRPNYDLDVMQQGQDLFDVTARSLLGLRDVLRKEKPDLVLVQGDTTTCFAAALAAFYEHIPVGHIEAGLRTGNLQAPFPEEANRSLVGRVASYHFPPTEGSRQNLLKEGVPEQRIWVTGNTVIDALLMVRDRAERYSEDYWQERFGVPLYERIRDESRRMILITGHRRENFGQGFVDLCSAIRDLAVQHPDWDLIYPVHLNPNVQEPAYRILGNKPNITLLPPLDYLPLVNVMKHSTIVLTDSGGIQEEAPGLGVPTLVLRNTTERPEGVEAGTLKLVGTDPNVIIKEARHLLDDPGAHAAMSGAKNPYGDGHAAERIVQAVLDF